MPPIGIKNNNYLNVKNGPDPWMDADGKRSKSDSKGHAVFKDPAFGVRAGILLLRTYYLKHNLRSVRAILSRWAPSADTIGSQPGNAANDPNQYAAFVSQRLGVIPDQTLELFHADRSIHNLGQLRDLFYAMAAYEIGGGFAVPAAEFTAGLKLIDPDLAAHGTVPAPLPASPGVPWRLTDSVGRADKGAANLRADVATVQSLLRHAAMILGDPRLDPGRIDGEIVARASNSDTVAAITQFQRRFLTKPDGVIGVEGRTWRELLAVIGGGSAADEIPSGAEFFPLASLPSADWKTGARKFGANRENNRAHAACDLYAPQGTVVHAIADGTVVRGPVAFYGGTFALEVDHGKFVARYGEIEEGTFVRAGDSVRGGQPIARVGHLVGVAVASDMLHLELYGKTAHGPLTAVAADSAITANGRLFLRRRDLLDPTPYLERWRLNLPGAGITAVAAPMAAAVAAAPGFCLRIRRLREEQRDGFPYARTVSEYQCLWNGAPVHDLEGQMVEREGPGDNTATGVAEHRRIAAGTYRLAIHRGQKYRTYGYPPSGPPLPGLLLLDTGGRTAILIHPTHHQHGYLSSIGCLNPTTGLRDADSRVNLADSRARVIAIIEALKAKLGAQFPQQGEIPGAVVVIEGEPT